MSDFAPEIYWPDWYIKPKSDCDNLHSFSAFPNMLSLVSFKWYQGIVSYRLNNCMCEIELVISFKILYHSCTFRINRLRASNLTKPGVGLNQLNRTDWAWGSKLHWEQKPRNNPVPGANLVQEHWRIKTEPATWFRVSNLPWNHWGSEPEPETSEGQSH